MQANHDKVPSLRSAFKQGSITAANTSPLNGASALIFVSAEKARD